MLDLEYRAQYSVEMRVFSATKKLLLSKPFNRITVKEICGLSQISRQTFYRHFADKYGIGVWHFSQVFDKALCQLGRILSWHEAHVRIFSAQLEERDFYVKALSPKGAHYSLDSHSKRLAIRCLTQILTDWKKIHIDAELEHQIRMYAAIAIETGNSWIESGMAEPPETVASLLDSCVPRKLFDLLEPDNTAV